MTQSNRSRLIHFRMCTYRIYTRVYHVIKFRKDTLERERIPYINMRQKRVAQIVFILVSVYVLYVVRTNLRRSLRG